MKKILGLALAGALSVAALPAVAADYALKAPPPPIWTWTGFYVGVAGGGVTSGTWTHAPGFPAESGGMDGGIFGGTIGWNWQNGIWVFGFEGDWSWTNFKGRAGCGAVTCGPNGEWLATARTRLGVASLGSTMFYITGGVAWASIHSHYDAPANQDQAASVSGWTVGGGGEFMVAPNWTFKGEVLWVDLNRASYPGGLAGGGIVVAPTTITSNFFVFRGGVNFKF
jgi:outer membrane immunogenic protein